MKDHLLAEQLLNKAIESIKRKDFITAKTSLKMLLRSDVSNVKALGLIVELELYLGDYLQAITYAKRLIELEPMKLSHRILVAKAYSSLNLWSDAASVYESYIDNNYQNADACFNYAYQLRKAGEFEKALKYYNLSFELGAQGKEEIFLNMAVIYSDDLRRESKAKELLIKSLEINKDYVPAMFNLANLFEQEGNEKEALKLFEKVLEVKPDYYDALSRVADLKTITNVQDPLISRLENICDSLSADHPFKVNLLFALAKCYDDCKHYSKAMNSYHKANKLNKSLQPLYSSVKMEQYVDNLKTIFNEKWFHSIPVISTERVIFICGMFRSGSTLAEQILASHSKITAGGEREFFVNLQHRKEIDFPFEFSKLNVSRLRDLSSRYIKDLSEAFPEGLNIIDKRPDNFIYLGLIKSLFPNVKIIHTKRNFYDNCLSIYFLRLGESMSYSNDLSHIAHYFSQQEALMNHWKVLFGESIFELSYDQLVQEPETSITKALDFLDLEWEDNCMNFHKTKSIVKTASVCQVRKPLYTSSSGRWNNYSDHIQLLMKQPETDNRQ